MEAQQIFETVSKHLFHQGVQSTSQIGCAYRGDNGTSCAVGCLIPDEGYSPGMEGMDAYDLCMIFDSIESIGELKPFTWLLMELQGVHDAGCCWADTKSMLHALGRVARQFNLDGSFLDNLSFKDR